MEAARASGALEDYQAYLDAFPDGLFAELVKIEIATLSEPLAESEPNGTGSGGQDGTEDTAQVFFDEPMTAGVPEILGKTIMEAAAGVPLFAPIDGLPEAVWKDKKCSSCHQWSRDDLCTQANTYLDQAASRSLGKQHPYGGSFKLNLKNWATGGCR